MKKQKEQIWIKVLRILLACVFLYSGYTKGIDPIATSITFDDYFTSFGMGFMHPLAMFFAFCMTAAEFTLGFMLLFRIKVRFTSVCYLLFMGFFFLLTAWLALAEYLEVHHGYYFGVVHDCGCFGEAIKLSNTATFLKNVVILSVTIIIFAKRKSIPDIRLTELGQWCFAAVGAMLIFGLETYCYRHLPIQDFSNWKVGDNVTESFIEQPEVKSMVFVYKNLQDSSIVNLSEDELMNITDQQPDFYDVYEFVDRKDSIISAYKRAPHDGFNMLDENGADNAADIFRGEGPVYIFFMHNLDETNVEGIQTEAFKNIVKKCEDQGIMVVGITNSTRDKIDEFVKENNISFPIYEHSIDPVKGPFMVRDAVRSNPGLIVIEGGVVKEKKAWREFGQLTIDN